MFPSFLDCMKTVCCLCIWLFSCSRRASILASWSLGNSAIHALGTYNLCHRQYTSNSHLFSYRVDHGGSAVVNSIAMVSILSFVDLPSPTLPRLSYVYIGTLTKSLFFPNHFPSYWFVYVCSCCSVGTCDDTFVKVDPNLFRTIRFDVKALQLIA